MYLPDRYGQAEKILMKPGRNLDAVIDDIVSLYVRVWKIPSCKDGGSGLADSAPILEVHDLVKDFGGVRALDHCSLEIEPAT